MSRFGPRFNEHRTESTIHFEQRHESDKEKETEDFANFEKQQKLTEPNARNDSESNTQGLLSLMRNKIKTFYSRLAFQADITSEDFENEKIQELFDKLAKDCSKADEFYPLGRIAQFIDNLRCEIVDMEEIMEDRLYRKDMKIKMLEDEVSLLKKTLDDVTYESSDD